MDTHYNNVKNNKELNIKYVKIDQDWVTYKEKHNIDTDVNKDNYIKYGTIYGTKYCVQTNYGNWDND